MRTVVAYGGTIRKILIVQVITEIISFRWRQKMSIKLIHPLETISSRITRSLNIPNLRIYKKNRRHFQTKNLSVYVLTILKIHSD